MTDPFDACFAIVVGEEGVYSQDPTDPGNWTGRAPGVGEMRGTKFGISAAAYPSLDIVNLTLAKAKAIYWTDYWTVLSCNQMVPPLALVVFDAGVNSGPSNSARWLQMAAGATVDGKIGPETLGDARKMAVLRGWPALIEETVARRLVDVSRAAIWADDALGLARRIVALPRKAMALGLA